MKTKQRPGIQTVYTWLPVFSGFYGTIWETDCDEEMEIDNINEQRAEKNLAPITWDDIEWDYDGYHKAVAEGVADAVADELKKLGMIAGFKFQELRSPREYNFANDSINMSFDIARKNVVAIAKYLSENLDAFKKYLADKYTSRSGFISFHSNNAVAWIGDVLGDTLADGHKLGSVLNFILLNEGADIEDSIYENLHGNGVWLRAENYDKLVPGGK